MFRIHMTYLISYLMQFKTKKWLYLSSPSYCRRRPERPKPDFEELGQDQKRLHELLKCARRSRFVQTPGWKDKRRTLAVRGLNHLPREIWGQVRLSRPDWLALLLLSHFPRVFPVFQNGSKLYRGTTKNEQDWTARRQSRWVPYYQLVGLSVCWSLRLSAR